MSLTKDQEGISESEMSVTWACLVAVTRRCLRVCRPRRKVGMEMS